MLNLTPHGESHFVQSDWASGQIFETLGVRTILGRTFTPAGCSAAKRAENVTNAVQATNGGELQTATNGHSTSFFKVLVTEKMHYPLSLSVRQKCAFSKSDSGLMTLLTANFLELRFFGPRAFPPQVRTHKAFRRSRRFGKRRYFSWGLHNA
jgi:hypothetical protein